MLEISIETRLRNATYAAIEIGIHDFVISLVNRYTDRQNVVMRSDL